jgi:hypothetical protein
MAQNPSLPVREARVRREAASNRPWAPRDVWLPAGALADMALRELDPAAGRQRALPDDAFEFRGGRPEIALRRRARTRRSDHPSQVTVSSGSGRR